MSVDIEEKVCRDNKEKMAIWVLFTKSQFSSDELDILAKTLLMLKEREI